MLPSPFIGYVVKRQKTDETDVVPAFPSSAIHRSPVREPREVNAPTASRSARASALIYITKFVRLTPKYGPTPVVVRSRATWIFERPERTEFCGLTKICRATSTCSRTGLRWVATMTTDEQAAGAPNYSHLDVLEMKVVQLRSFDPRCRWTINHCSGRAMHTTLRHP